MAEIDDGGPAFPTLETERFHPQFGMTLRDYFAAQAMTGFLLGARSEGWAIPNSFQNEMLSRNAYATADAMIIARSSIKATSPSGANVESVSGSAPTLHHETGSFIK